jgi:hypothetical protein
MKHAMFRIPALVCLVLLAGSPVWARPGAAAAVETRTVPPIFRALLQTLEALFPAIGEGRASMDPNGTDPGTTTTVTPSGEEGDGRASMDPNG